MKFIKELKMHDLNTIIRLNREAANRALGQAQEKFEDQKDVLPIQPVPQEEDDNESQTS
jgi:hypothetical protein